MGLLNTFHPAQARFISSGACSSKFYATSSRQREGGCSGEDVGNLFQEDVKFGVVKVNEGQVEVGLVDSRLNDFCKRTGLEAVRYLTILLAGIMRWGG